MGCDLSETEDQRECAIASDRTFHAFCGMCKASEGQGIAMYAEKAGFANTIVQTVGHVLDTKPAWIASMDRYLQSEGVNRPDVLAWFEEARRVIRQRQDHFRGYKAQFD